MIMIMLYKSTLLLIVYFTLLTCGHGNNGAGKNHAAEPAAEQFGINNEQNAALFNFYQHKFDQYKKLWEEYRNCLYPIMSTLLNKIPMNNYVIDNKNAYLQGGHCYENGIRVEVEGVNGSHSEKIVAVIDANNKNLNKALELKMARTSGGNLRNTIVELLHDIQALVRNKEFDLVKIESIKKRCGKHINSFGLAIDKLQKSLDQSVSSNPTPPISRAKTSKTESKPLSRTESSKTTRQKQKGTEIKSQNPLEASANKVVKAATIKAPIDTDPFDEIHNLKAMKAWMENVQRFLLRIQHHIEEMEGNLKSGKLSPRPQTLNTKPTVKVNVIADKKNSQIANSLELVVHLDNPTIGKPFIFEFDGEASNFGSDGLY